MEFLHDCIHSVCGLNFYKFHVFFIMDNYHKFYFEFWSLILFPWSIWSDEIRDKFLMEHNDIMDTVFNPTSPMSLIIVTCPLDPLLSIGVLCPTCQLRKFQNITDLILFRLYCMQHFHFFSFLVNFYTFWYYASYSPFPYFSCIL